MSITLRRIKNEKLTHEELDNNFTILDKKDIQIVTGYGYDEYYNDSTPRFYFNTITKKCITIIGSSVFDCMGNLIEEINSTPDSTPNSQ